MNKGPMCVLAFAIGAAVGSVAAWKLLEAKYKQIAQEEIDSVKEAFSHVEPKSEETDDISQNEGDTITPVVMEKPDIREYAAKLQKQSYTNYAGAPTASDLEVNGMLKRPYVISPEEFSELADYETRSLTYYADGVLADEDNIPIEDVDNVVGEDFADHFGEYEDDSVFVRNDKEQADYEILLDPRRFSDVINSNPHRTEGE